MAVSSSVENDVMTIKISDRFDFSIHSELRRTYENTAYAGYVIDLSETQYMDSAALGMLLQLREYAGGTMDAVTIKDAAPMIRKVLEVANFDRLMHIQ